MRLKCERLNCLSDIFMLLVGAKCTYIVCAKCGTEYGEVA